MSKSTWVLDASHTVAEFSVKHMMIANVKGRFSGVAGVFVADPADLTTATFDVTVDVATVDTRDGQRDGHLRSADFFDAENHPQISFKSTGVTARGDGEYALTGHLTIRGVTKEVTLSLTYEGQGKDPWGNERLGLSVAGQINRKDFGLTWNVALETGGILVGDVVKLEVHGEAIKQATAAA